MFITPKARRIVDLKRALIEASSGNEYDCATCKGTGLSNWYKSDTGNITWDGVSYCDDCEGVGKLDWLDKIMGRTVKK